MRRRDFIILLGAVTIRSAARAQQPGTPIVGILSSAADPDPNPSRRAAFRQGMREVGYIEGQVSLEIQDAAGQYDRLPALAKSLVDRHVSVLAN